MATLHSYFAILALSSGLIHAQMLAALPAIQTTSWNSTFQLSAEQLALGNFTFDYGTILDRIINFDRTQLANGGPSQDAFYNFPLNGSVPTDPGQVIKVEEHTDPASWSIPAKTAMSRIMYSTTNINGTLIPASAYILWPYQAKSFHGSQNQSSQAAPVVLWTHGTSGFYPSGAPSTHRALFYADFVPFTLAEAGYVVVAPDYAGLGVGTSWDGTRIPHQYGVRNAGARDALNALRAAKGAFPGHLSEHFVSMGHSQGGAVAWGLAEILAQQPCEFEDLVAFHLGSVLAAPPTDITTLAPELFLPWIGKDLHAIYPEFNLSDWLTPLGVARTELLNQVEGSQMVSTYMFQPSSAIVNPGYKDSWAYQWFPQLGQAGRQPFKGPLLIFQGTSDPGVPYNTTVKTVEETCQTQSADLELLTISGAEHFSAINAARQYWLNWIADRFEGRDIAQHGCGVRTELQSFLPVERYQATPNSFPLWAGQTRWIYELPTAA